MTIALSSLVNDYVQSASDSDDSEPTPLIVFTPEDDNTDWKKGDAAWAAAMLEKIRMFNKIH